MEDAPPLAVAAAAPAAAAVDGAARLSMTVRTFGAADVNSRPNVECSVAMK